MKAPVLALTFLFSITVSGAALAAKRDVSDPRRTCREAIQKSMGQNKDAKVSRKAIDRCVENGGKI